MWCKPLGFTAIFVFWNSTAYFLANLWKKKNTAYIPVFYSLQYV